jgi:hypothetical protein
MYRHGLLRLNTRILLGVLGLPPPSGTLPEARAFIALMDS